MLDPANGLATGDPARMAARIIDSADVEARTEVAASTDDPEGE